ncbi:MAG TPA: FAD:protein FMN transferase, partial [Polyangia bacterium]
VADARNPGEWAARLFLKDGAIALAARPACPAAGACPPPVDPRTGTPAGGLDAAAVVAPDALTAAAVAEAALALGPRAGAALVERLQLRAVYRSAAGVEVSPDLRDTAILRAGR